MGTKSKRYDMMIPIWLRAEAEECADELQVSLAEFILDAMKIAVHTHKTKRAQVQPDECVSHDEEL